MRIKRFFKIISNDVLDFLSLVLALTLTLAITTLLAWLGKSFVAIGYAIFVGMVALVLFAIISTLIKFIKYINKAWNNSKEV